MVAIKSKKELKKPMRFQPSGLGGDPEYDLREVDDGSLIAELIRRGWISFIKEQDKAVNLTIKKGGAK